MEDNNKGWFNYDADDAFHFERQIDGIVYGPEALVKKLQNQREALYVTTKFEDAMYGFVIADALGVPAEFKSRNSLSKSPITDMVGYGTHNVPEGTWSDDTSMVLATQDSINKCGKIDYDDIMNRFAAWYKKGEYTTDGKVFDIGITTSNAIRNYSSGKKALKCGGTGERDNGNGSLMRMIPVAFYIHDNGITDERVEMIGNVSALTHAHDISKLGCLIYCDYVNELLNGKSKMAALISVRGNDYTKYFSKDIVSKYDKVLRGNLANLSEKEISSSGYVVDTLTAAIWCLLTTNKYEDAVLKAVNLGEDTDTVAAVCGSLAGIVYTKKNIPGNWIEKLKNRDLLNNIISGYKKKLNNSSNFELIKNQLLDKKTDVSFDKTLLETLSPEEKNQIDELIINEVLNHNVNCYYYIDCLSSVEKINEEFLATLTGTFRYVVLKGLYLVNHNDVHLNELVENAYQKIFCFDLLADIYVETKNEQIYETLSKIFSEMNEDPAYQFIAASKLNMTKGHSI